MRTNTHTHTHIRTRALALTLRRITVFQVINFELLKNQMAGKTIGDPLHLTLLDSCLVPSCHLSVCRGPSFTRSLIVLTRTYALRWLAVVDKATTFPCYYMGHEPCHYSHDKEKLCNVR
jgi:hypothetical protein